VPESKSRKEADEKKTSKRAHDSGQGKSTPVVGQSGDPSKAKAVKKHTTTKRVAASRDWVPWLFVPTGLLGVAWLVVYYIAGQYIGFMNAIGGWNFGIGIGLIAVAFVLLTFWK
jgi:hypothetical protein